MVKKAVEGGCGNGIICHQLSPAAKRLVGRQYDGALFIVGVHNLE